MDLRGTEFTLHINAAAQTKAPAAGSCTTNPILTRPTGDGDLSSSPPDWGLLLPEHAQSQCEALEESACEELVI